MSQDDLAAKAGILKETISRIENNHIRAPRPRTVLKLARALETNPLWLRFGEGDPDGEPTTQEER